MFSNRDLILKAVRRSCIVYTNSEANWRELKTSGADNKRIREQLRVEFGYGGGANFDGGFVYHRGGQTPEIEIHFGLLSDDSQDDLIISGAQLVDLVREVFEIPAEDGGFQPRLF